MTKKNCHEGFLEFLTNLNIPEKTFSLEEASQKYTIPCMPPVEGEHLSINLGPFSTVQLIGSYANNLQINNNSHVDVFLGVPSQRFHHKDYINYRYHTKCAFILASLKQHYITGAEWQTMENYIPCLNVSKNDLGYRLIVGIDKDVFNVSMRLAPDRNNIRSYGDQPTTFYNASLACHINSIQDTQQISHALKQIPALQDAIKVIKAWLYVIGYDRFSTRALNSHSITLFSCEFVSIFDPAMDMLGILQIIFQKVADIQNNLNHIKYCDYSPYALECLSREAQVFLSTFPDGIQAIMEI